MIHKVTGGYMFFHRSYYYVMYESIVNRVDYTYLVGHWANSNQRTTIISFQYLTCFIYTTIYLYFLPNIFPFTVIMAKFLMEIVFEWISQADIWCVCILIVDQLIPIVVLWNRFFKCEVRGFKFRLLHAYEGRSISTRNET